MRQHPLSCYGLHFDGASMVWRTDQIGGHVSQRSFLGKRVTHADLLSEATKS
jgi:hypothetical protein